MMTIHRMLAEAVAALLHDVFDRGRVLDMALAGLFKSQPRWGKRDRAFVAASVFEIVRWRRALGFLADHDDIRALCAAQWTLAGADLPGWWQHPGASAAEIRARETGLPGQPRAIRESIPDWLDAHASERLGEAWDAEIHALNQRAPVVLRVNSARATRESVMEWLHSHGIQASVVGGLPHAIALPVGKILPKPLLADGRIEIQDAGSQHIAPALAAQPGDHVIDACAGGGGKSLHLAAIMENTGRIDAMDIAPGKLRNLDQRARRAGAAIIRTHVIGPRTVVNYQDRADRLLLDVPCSGLGTLRRQPDLKWRLTPERLRQVIRMQQRILAGYPAMLKAGGRLVYATCSILPEENEGAIRKLADDPSWRMISRTTISPAASGFDGFFAAAFERVR